jgi:hypothetical protein
MPKEIGFFKLQPEITVSNWLYVANIREVLIEVTVALFDYNKMGIS